MKEIQILRRIYASRGSEQVANINTIPLIVLPGVMGSRLRIRNGSDTVDWDPNDKSKMVWWVNPFRKSATKGLMLDYRKPAIILRDKKNASADQLARGWGTIAWDYYGDLLNGLEQIAQEVQSNYGILLPVYAVGYDWRQPILQSSKMVCQEIEEILKNEDARWMIIITHSMGGLVARAMLKNHSEIASKTLGVIHVMQPVNGAPAMYIYFWTTEGEPFIMQWLYSQPFAHMVRRCAGAFHLLPTHKYDMKVKYDKSTWIWPVPGYKKITSGVGERTLGGKKHYHSGIDIEAPKGASIVAAKDGKVTTVIKNCKEGEKNCGGGYGNVVYIDHGDGLQTRYAHCSEVLVDMGQEVKAGQEIAKVGSTGDSTGPHLHFEVKVTMNGQLIVIDPQKLEYIDDLNKLKDLNKQNANWLIVYSKEIESKGIYQTYIDERSDARLTRWGYEQDIISCVEIAQKFHSWLDLYKHPNTWSIYSTNICDTKCKFYIQKEGWKCELGDGDGTVPDISAAALFPDEATEFRNDTELMNYLIKGKRQFVVRGVQHNQPGHSLVINTIKGIIYHILFYYELTKPTMPTSKPTSQSDKIKELEEALEHPNVRAMLQVIRYGEGTTGDVGYRMLFGGDTFNDFSKHPNKTISKGGYTTTAAGAYQFLNTTWQGLVNQYGFRDFSPRSQDLGAVALIKQRGALEDVKSGRFREAIYKISWEWASLPGPDGKSRYGQPVKSIEELERIYKNNGGQVSG